MPETARIVRLPDKLELFVFEGSYGVRLDTYRSTLHNSLPFKTSKLSTWPQRPSDELFDKRFATIDELEAALRHELGPQPDRHRSTHASTITPRPT